MRGILKPAKSLVVASSGIVLLCAGCIIPRCDVAPEYRSSAFQSVGVVDAPRPVNIEIEFRDYGVKWRSIAERLRPDIVRGLTASKVFVEADATNRDQAGQLHIVVYEPVEAKKLGEAIAKGAVNGLTSGLISTTIESHYDMDITYTPPGGSPTTWKGHHPYSMVNGLKSYEKSENSVDVLEVPDELAAGMAAKFAQDFAMQHAGAAYANATPAGAATSGVIQSAAVVTPASTMVR